MRSQHAMRAGMVCALLGGGECFAQHTWQADDLALLKSTKSTRSTVHSVEASEAFRPQRLTTWPRAVRVAGRPAPPSDPAWLSSGDGLYVGLQEDDESNGFWSYGESVYWALDDGRMSVEAAGVGGGRVEAYQFGFALHSDFAGDVIHPYVIVSFYNAPSDPVSGATDPVVHPPDPVSSIGWVLEPIMLPASGEFFARSELIDLTMFGATPFQLDDTFYVEILPLEWNGTEGVFDPDIHAAFTGPGAVTVGANDDHMWSDRWIRNAQNERVFGDGDSAYDHPSEMDAGGHAPFLNQSPIRLLGSLCTEPNRLELMPTAAVDQCVQPERLVRVDLAMSCLPLPVRGYQAFLAFEEDRLAFVSGTYHLPLPFGLPIIDPIIADGADINLAAGIHDEDGQTPTSASAGLATVTFRAGAIEGPTRVRFRAHQPPARFTGDLGEEIVPTLIDSPDILIDGTDPVITCPADVVVTPPAGSCAANVDVAMATAVDNLDPDPLIEFKRSDRTNWNEGLDDPYEGVVIITWRATDCAGNFTTCDQSIEVRPLNRLFADVQLSPIVSSPISRCITFELIACDSDPVTVEAEAVFIDGIAEGVELLVPCGAYDCITARDRLHTLSRTDEAFHVDNDAYVADFTGDPELGGDWLIGGNLDGSDEIDLADLGVFLVQYGSDFGSGDTDCDTASPHSDISGDGVVFTEDLTFIQINHQKTSEQSCCGPPQPGKSEP